MNPETRKSSKYLGKLRSKKSPKYLGIWSRRGSPNLPPVLPWFMRCVNPNLPPLLPWFTRCVNPNLRATDFPKIHKGVEPVREAKKFTKGFEQVRGSLSGLPDLVLELKILYVTIWSRNRSSILGKISEKSTEPPSHFWEKTIRSLIYIPLAFFGPGV